jgi:hypothetical protein
MTGKEDVRTHYLFRNITVVHLDLLFFACPVQASRVALRQFAALETHSAR